MYTVCALWPTWYALLHTPFMYITLSCLLVSCVCKYVMSALSPVTCLLYACIDNGCSTPLSPLQRAMLYVMSTLWMHGQRYKMWYAQCSWLTETDGRLHGVSCSCMNITYLHVVVDRNRQTQLKLWNRKWQKWTYKRWDVSKRRVNTPDQLRRRYPNC